MARRLLLSLTLAFGLALPAMAQPAGAPASVRHPKGWSVTLPAGMRAAPNAVQGDLITLMLVRGNTAAGACSVTVNTQPTALTATVWDRTANSFLANAEGEGREAATRSGHAFIRHLGSAPIRSAAGWSGFSFWYERTNKTSGQLQSAYLASTMLSPTQRLSLACSSTAGHLLEPADYVRFKALATSARAD
ncbi:hypothetical protein GVN21_01270 [Caulobacter sp. SLTY]|uniref:hypothetical protein n=1 Tax=Caulobacter sp. SLTY TaxID=2683262 RepID=UPI001411FDC6|nr:hypothetical protein [Caulobacter sp. SLTY]NBB13980.1 hypothetical protein [Caulobacter sp. SLTY]